MTPQEAVEAPRFQTEAFYSSFATHQFAPGQLNLEDRIPKATADKLASLGHKVRVTGPWSNASAPIVIKSCPQGVLEAGRPTPAAAASSMAINQRSLTSYVFQSRLYSSNGNSFATGPDDIDLGNRHRPVGRGGSGRASQATPSGGGARAATLTNRQGTFLLPALGADAYVLRGRPAPEFFRLRKRASRCWSARRSRWICKSIQLRLPRPSMSMKKWSRFPHPLHR